MIINDNNYKNKRKWKLKFIQTDKSLQDNYFLKN